MNLLLLFWLFFKIGLVFFGGGYAAIPVIHKELVTNLHLLTNQEFLDGTAISQLTPGPVAIIATFAGYMISGVKGAIVGTFAMFLPGSALMFLISKNYEKIKNSYFAFRILSTIIPVIVGLLIATSFKLGYQTFSGWYDVVLFIVALVVILRFKINPAVLILAAIFLGIVRTVF